jgi:hypothetical protein
MKRPGENERKTSGLSDGLRANSHQAHTCRVFTRLCESTFLSSSDSSVVLIQIRMTFGLGQYACIGFKFALMEISKTLAVSPLYGVNRLL